MSEPYKTVKISLKKILKDPDKIQPIINEIVERCNEVVIRTYQFIRLYILDKYHNNKDIPEITENFILYCMKTVGKRDNRGKKKKNQELEKELSEFYDKEFKPLINKEKIDIKCLVFILPYLSTQILTSISNNLQERFLKHLERFIKEIGGKGYDKTNNSQDTKKTILNQLKFAFLNDDKEKVPNIFRNFYNHYRDKLLPPDIEKCVAYDIKKNPLRYLKYSLYINEQLEKNDFKMYQTIPLRNDIIPKYIIFDTASLIDVLEGKGKGNLLSKIKENQENIWSKYFKLSNRVFRKKGYIFNFMIQTDGIGVSLSFIRKDLKGKKFRILTKSDYSEEKDIPNLIDLNESQLNSLKGRNIIGCDPGKQSLVYMVDNNNKKLRYTASQRKIESYSKKNQRIILNEKKKNDIIEIETKFSKYNSKTVNYRDFKRYIEEKTILNDKIRDFYNKPLFRKLKWRHHIYTQKSEDKFLNRIGETFGKDCVIIYGNWSRSTQMKHTMPTIGKGLRKLISKQYDTFLIDEFRTSKNCCNCWESLQNVKVDKNNKFRLLKCENCNSTPCDNIIFFTRDHNSAVNMRTLGTYWITKKERPKKFCRQTPFMSYTESSECRTEKIGRSCFI